MPSDVPKLTVAVAVHREQGWVTELVASVLAQENADLELLAIDDASPDHAPEILDRLAERDPRMRVRHLPSRVGPGEARNIALDEAAGEYVWFVESTDLLPPGAARRVIEGLGGDVLVVRHAVADLLGRLRPGRAVGPRPESAAFAQNAWDKVFRRAFLQELGVRFGSGAHSELTVTWPALIAADRVDGIPEPSYTRRRPPNAEREPGSPFDVFAQYDKVFAFAEARSPQSRELIVAAMLRHQIALLARVPAAERGEFFRRMSDSYNGHRAGAEPRFGSRSLALRARLIARRDERGYRALERSVELGRTARPARLKGRIKRSFKARTDSTQRHYRARLRQPIDPDLAVFAAYWYRDYSCNPRAIYEKARELVPGFHGVWAVKPDGVERIPDGVEHVVAGTREYYDLIARARWFVNNVNFPNHLVKREGTTHVMTHHGTPLKRMGLDLRSAPDGGERKGMAAMLRRCARWDYSVSQNAFTTPIWERVYPARYESLEVGYPRNDALAAATDDEVARAREKLGIRAGQRALLYAPTHREYQKEFVPVLDVGALADALGSDWLVMPRAHYFYDADPHVRELHRQGRVLDVSDHRSIEELCLAADLLVTDYSSIMFDYGALDRPIVVHAPDLDEYESRRGTTFDVTSEGPGVVTRSDAELVDALHSGNALGDEAARMRAAFRARFCYLDDGHAAERVVRRVWLGESLDPVAPPAAAFAT
jgi:CDP-glycerol glycerophosphotransferase